MVLSAPSGYAADSLNRPALGAAPTSCGFDLSPVSEQRLILAACSGNDISTSDTPSGHLAASLVERILDAAGVDIVKLVDEYFRITHNWLPILDKETLAFPGKTSWQDTGAAEDQLEAKRATLHSIANRYITPLPLRLVRCVSFSCGQE